MMSRRVVVIGFSLLGALVAASGASAQDVRVTESAPKASAVIEGRSSEFFVRFDRPVDHIHSQLAITRNGQLVEKLVPRLESAPEVLYARAPTLPAGDYDLNWRVKTMTGTDVIQGNIPFTVKP
ncbi:MAG: copper resistance protein CopC [Reyranella sp.]|uniref:copper resistance CopC family protein n=1 Tax=Reyranella sp. TaxID=1929291 RepID=UPI0027302040|nr:copper resistance protein CopC [Reyranella sp.]MDP1966755.1 copper resistance protein CopC [Reyranella sp.]MDP2372645.1 copper resistance protein CopC [Reyranella sp.]